MQCPSCSRALHPLQVGDMVLDACQDGCGGVWFDPGEIDKFDEPHEFPTHQILALAEEKQGVRVDSSVRKLCPRCSEEPLIRQFFDHRNEIEIDQCWSCGGIWFDLGEINTVRAQYQTFTERQQAVNSYIDERIDEHVREIEHSTKEHVVRLNEENRSRIAAGISVFRKLLLGA